MGKGGIEKKRWAGAEATIHGDKGGATTCHVKGGEGE